MVNDSLKECCKGEITIVHVEMEGDILLLPLTDSADASHHGTITATCRFYTLEIFNLFK